jgi:hypothetical protein
MAGLVEIAHDKYRHVVAGTARVRWGDHGKLKDLLIVSAEIPRGKRVDIDSSRCGYIAQGLIEHINGNPEDRKP